MTRNNGKRADDTDELDDSVPLGPVRRADGIVVYPARTDPRLIRFIVALDRLLRAFPELAKTQTTPEQQAALRAARELVAEARSW